jgi:hypothetical protein
VSQRVIVKLKGDINRTIMISTMSTEHIIKILCSHLHQRKMEERTDPHAVINSL